MGRAGVAVDAPMFAATVSIDAGVKADIRAVVVGNDGLGRIGEKLSVGRRDFVVAVGWLRDPLDGFEAILRIAGRSSTAHPTRRFHANLSGGCWCRWGSAVCGGAGAAALAAAAVLVSCAR